MTSSLHHRNPSHSDDEGTVASNELSSHSRSGVNSSPTVPAPFRAPTLTSGALQNHSRTQSFSSPYSPTLPSPLSFSFPNSSTSPTDSSAPSKQTRRHARIHSRNLSVFFPRPAGLAQSTISEDGSQELEIKPDEAPVTTISSAPGMHRSRSETTPHTPFGVGFTFGSRPPGSVSLGTPTSSSSRRGHHHKHSLSHNFFSFLEPGADLGGPSPTEELHTQPTLTPQSPWAKVEFPTSPAPLISPVSPQNGHADAQLTEPLVPVAAIFMACSQFVLGAWLWVSGQQIGSLSCTGLGYWIVFDSFGIVVSRLLPWYLDAHRQPTMGDMDAIQRPYGTGRLQTVFAFSQVVYLLFSSVYVCKETVEHLLLSAGTGEGHHHHHGDEDAGLGIDFPVVLVICSALSIVASALRLDNHANLVEIAGNRIASLLDFVLSTSPQHVSQDVPTGATGTLLSNPYVLSPLLFSTSILVLTASVPPVQHRTFDLVVASVITVITFNVAFRASTVLGTVLLQTSPPRGLPGGRMEAFLRAMRELERHPQVLHLPPPHIWQLTPAPKELVNGRLIPLIVTLELHVREDLSDDDVLILTNWAWEKCVVALGGSKTRSTGARVEVTVGVVRG